VTFGPPELAQLMREAQATIAVAMLSSAGAGIVLGSIIACCNIFRAKRQRVRATGQQVARALAGDASSRRCSRPSRTRNLVCMENGVRLADVLARIAPAATTARFRF
jgi:hypothetical protein